MKPYQPLLIDAEFKKPDISASDLTSFALEMFRLQNYRVRRVSNVATYKKFKNQVQSGWSDIQGFDPNGKAVLCEVKKKGDVFTHVQYDLLMDCHNCGGSAWVCVDIKGSAELLRFIDYASNIKLPKKSK